MKLPASTFGWEPDYQAMPAMLQPPLPPPPPQQQQQQESLPGAAQQQQRHPVTADMQGLVASPPADMQQQQQHSSDGSEPHFCHLIQADGSNKCSCSCGAATDSSSSVPDLACKPVVAKGCISGVHSSSQACHDGTGSREAICRGSSSRSTAAGASTTHICSIYDLFNRPQRYLMLAVCASAAALAPLADTIYIPSLYAVRKDLHTSQELVAGTVAIYMLVVGVCTLLWGPASDRYGRRPILLASTVMFVAFTTGCYFAKTIGMLILFRGLQGAAVASYGSTGTGVIADTWPPHLRGTALGISTIPLLIGPLLGPVLGGGLAQAFGWRSTFLALVIVAGTVILPLIVFGVPETHPYWNLARLQQRDPHCVEGLKEAAQICARTPRFEAPWYPYQILMDRYVILHAVCTLVTFGSTFCSVTQLPVLLAQPPYGPNGAGMSSGSIGLACLSASAAGIVVAPLGGRIADYSAGVHGRNAHPLQRLLYNNALNMVLKPLGLLLYGWSAQFKLHLALPLVGMFLIGVSNNVYLPGIFSFVTNYRPQAAAAAAAGIHSVMCVSSGVLIMFGAVAVQALGSGLLFSMLAALNFAASLAAACQIFACSGVSSWQQLREFSSSSFRMGKDLQLLQAAASGTVDEEPCSSGAAPRAASAAGKV